MHTTPQTGNTTPKPAQQAAWTGICGVLDPFAGAPMDPLSTPTASVVPVSFDWTTLQKGFRSRNHALGVSASEGVAAFLGAAVQKGLTHPLDVASTRMNMGARVPWSSPAAMMRGFSFSVGASSVLQTAVFMTNESLTRHTPEHDSLARDVATSVGSSVVWTSVFSPYKNLRQDLQMGTHGSVREAFAARGLRSMYQGTLPYVGYNTVYNMTALPMLRAVRNPDDSLPVELAKSAGCGVIAGANCWPLEYIRSHRWAGTLPQDENAVTLLAKELVREGPWKIYRGYPPLAARMAAQLALVAPVYNRIMDTTKG